MPVQQKKEYHLFLSKKVKKEFPDKENIEYTEPAQICNELTN